MENTEDDRLIHAAVEGDRAAFGELYLRYARMVHGILLARVPAGDAEDLVQDVFLSAMRQLRGLRTAAAFRGWLGAIARNRAIDYFRQARQSEGIQIIDRDAVLLHHAAGDFVVANLVARDAARGIGRNRRGQGEDQLRARLFHAANEQLEVFLVIRLTDLAMTDARFGGFALIVEMSHVVQAEVEVDHVPFFATNTIGGEPLVEIDGGINAGETVAAGSLRANILHTPGHTEGSICLYFPAEQKLIAGDTLFAGSIGRTDLPGGSMQKILRSLHDTVLALPDETVVVSGHGPLTTIGEERESNPFLIRKS